jgi:hypothetical protein
MEIYIKNIIQKITLEINQLFKKKLEHFMKLKNKLIQFYYQIHPKMKL